MKLWEGNVFTPVCDSVHPGGGLCPGDLCHGDPPSTVEGCAVRILLECILVFNMWVKELLIGPVNKMNISYNIGIHFQTKFVGH